jgi:hypothetical protein
MAEAGSVTPAVDRVIALDQVPDAIRDLTRGRVRGTPRPGTRATPPSTANRGRLAARTGS